MALSLKELEQINKTWQAGKAKQAEMANKSKQAPAKNRTVPVLETKAEKAQKVQNNRDMQSMQMANDLMASQKSAPVQEPSLPRSVNKLGGVSTDMTMPSPVNKLVDNTPKNIDTKNKPSDSLNPIKSKATWSKDYDKRYPSDGWKELSREELQGLEREARRIQAKGVSATIQEQERLQEIYGIAKENDRNKAIRNKATVDDYLTPGRRLSDDEQSIAKEIVDNYFKENPKAKKMLQMSSSNANQAAKIRSQMSESERREYEKMTALMNKTSNLSAFTYGMLNIMPFENTAMDKMGEMMGVDPQYNYSAQKKNVKTQSPLAYLGGDMTSKMAAYSVLGGELEKIPALAKATNSAGSFLTRGNQVAGDMVGKVLRGDIADVILDTIPTEIENYQNGMRGGELVKDTLGNIALNTLFNGVFEGVPYLINRGRGFDNVTEAIAPQRTQLEMEREALDSAQNDMDMLSQYLRENPSTDVPTRPTNLEMEQAMNNRPDDMEVLRQAMAEQEAGRIASGQATNEIPRVGEESSLVSNTTTPDIIPTISKKDARETISNLIKRPNFKPITFVSGDTQYIIHRSTREGKWQLSFISDTGEFLGHKTFETDEDLLKAINDFKRNEFQYLNYSGHKLRGSETTWGEMVNNPDSYSYDDFARALRTWDRNANPEDFEKEDLVNALLAEIEYDPTMADMRVDIPYWKQDAETVLSNARKRAADEIPRVGEPQSLVNEAPQTDVAREVPRVGEEPSLAAKNAPEATPVQEVAQTLNHRRQISDEVDNMLDNVSRNGTELELDENTRDFYRLAKLVEKVKSNYYYAERGENAISLNDVIPFNNPDLVRFQDNLGLSTAEIKDADALVDLFRKQYGKVFDSKGGIKSNINMSDAVQDIAKPKNYYEYINTKKLKNNIKFDNQADKEAFDAASKELFNRYQKVASNPTFENIEAFEESYRNLQKIASNGYELNNSTKDVYRQMKKDFANRTKGMTIKLSDTDLAEMTDMNFTSLNRKLSTLGNNTGLKFRKGSGTPIDTMWDDLVAASGGQLDPNVSSTQDMVRALVDYVDDLQMKINNPVAERIPADINQYIPDELWDDMADYATRYNDAIRAAENHRVDVNLTDEFEDEVREIAEDIGINPNTRLEDDIDVPDGRVTDYGSVKLEEEVPQGSGIANERPEFDNPNPQFGTSDFYNNTLKKIVDEDNFAKYYDEADYLYEKGSHNQMLDNSYNILKKDFAGEYNRLLNTENFTAQDVATASMIRDFLSKSGHEKEAAEFVNRIRPVMSTSTAQVLEAHKLFAKSTPEGAVDELIIQINKAIDRTKGDGYSATVQRLGDKVADAIKNDDEDLLVEILDGDLGTHALGTKSKVRYKNKKVQGKQEVLDFVKEAKTQKKSAAEIAEEAKKMLIKANGGANVSHEAESTLLDLAEDMEKLDPKSREYKELEAQMARYAQNFMPSSLGNKVKSILYSNMLGNLKTALTRNFGGNVIANTVEKAQKPLRTGLDTLLGKKTGVRNYTMGNTKEQIKAYGGGFKRGFVNQLQDIKTGLNTTRSGEEGLLNALNNNTKAWKYDTPMVDSKLWKSDASVTDKGRNALNKVNDVVRGVMGLGDTPIYEAQYAATKAELNYILDKFGENAIQTAGTTGKEASVGDLINFWAHQRALESVFQQGSLTASGLTKIKQAIGDISKDSFGVDILSMPVSAFTQVPGNMISVGMDYSPAGIIKNAANTISELRNGNFNQKRFVDQTSRNLTGGLMLGGGVAAYQHGRITGPKSEDTDKNKAESSANELEYALRLPGNVQMDISDVPYIGGTLQGAAEFANALDEAKRGEITYPEAWSRGIGGAIEAQFGTSAMQGYNRILGAGNTYNTSNTMADNLKNTLGSSLSMVVPSLIRQTAAATDEYKRDLGKYGTFDYYWNNVKNSVPGLRETLPVKTNNQGVPYLQNQGRNIFSKLAENYVLPYTISQPDRVYSDMDKVANSLYDLLGTEANPAYTPGISRTTAKEWLGDNYSEDNYYLLKQQYGGYDSELGNAVINSDIFSQLSPEAQVKALNDVHVAAKELTNRDYGAAKSNTTADLYQNDKKEEATDSILYNALFADYGNDNVKVKYTDYSKDYYNTYGEQGLDALKKVIGSSTKQEQWLANLRDHSKELNLSDAQVESMIRAIKGDDLAQDVRNGKKTASEYYLGKAGNSSSTYNKETTKEETTRTGLNSNVPDTVEEMMRQADTSNRDGYPNAKEAQIYLDSLNLTREQKAEIYPQMFRKAPRENPYK